MKDITNSLSDKQRLILYFVYVTYLFPLDIFDSFPNTFTKSNLRYKLIPRLISAGMVSRINVGYNKAYGENEEQKGKAIYDTLKITSKGKTWVENNEINKELKNVRKYYKSQFVHSSAQVEERLKRTVMTDMLLNPQQIVDICEPPANVKQNTHQSLLKDLENVRYSYRYWYGILCKRSNLDTLGNLTKIDTTLKRESGLSISSSRFISILKSNNTAIPVYHTGRYNLTIKRNNEEALYNKLSVETGTLVNKAVCIYQSKAKMRELIERGGELDKWKHGEDITEIPKLSEIYIMPCTNKCTEYELIQKILLGTPIQKYYRECSSFEGDRYLLLPALQRRAKEEYYGIFDAIDEEYNYYFGHLPELHKLIKILDEYKCKNNKSLCVLCNETQKEFYSEIFSSIKERGLLYFLTSEIKDKRKGGENEEKRKFER